MIRIVAMVRVEEGVITFLDLDRITLKELQAFAAALRGLPQLLLEEVFVLPLPF